jgi:four helix bundle protein
MGQPIRSFEDLEVYKLARQFRKDIYQLIKTLPETEKYNLASQMRRAALSVTNNIAEGYGRYHFQENIQFCRHTRGSLNELIDNLNVCIDENYFADNICIELKDNSYTLIKVLNAYIASLKRQKEIVTK